MVTLSALKIREVRLIGVSLPLKRYCPISLMAVSEDNQPYKPFDEIPQIKENIEHFLHLLSMYQFVIKSLITNRPISPSEEYPEEVHISKTSRGNEFILYYLH